MELKQPFGQIVSTLFTLADHQHPEWATLSLLPRQTAELGIPTAPIVLAIVDAFLSQALYRFRTLVQFKKEMEFACLPVILFQNADISVGLHGHTAIFPIDDKAVAPWPYAKFQQFKARIHTKR